jgi:hypothetical protein
MGLLLERESRSREITTAELREYVQLYSKAASNAMEAGFDGVEIHGLTERTATSWTNFCRWCQINGQTNMEDLSITAALPSRGDRCGRGDHWRRKDSCPHQHMV